MNDAEVKTAFEIARSEIFTLNEYLKNPDMVMHHFRFKRMIDSLNILTDLAQLYLSTARRMPEEISEIEIPAFDTKDFTVEQRARILLYISLAFRSRFVTGQNKARQECILSYAKREQELKEQDGICYYCGKMTNSLAGNPGQWAVMLCHSDEPGKVKYHHQLCVSKRLELPSESDIFNILDKYSAKLIRIMRLEKDVEDAVIKSDLLQMEAAHEIKELIKAELKTIEKPLLKLSTDYRFGKSTQYGITCYNQALSDVVKIVETL